MKKILFLAVATMAVFSLKAQELKSLGGYGHKFDRLAANKFFRPPVVADTICDLVPSAINGTCLGALVTLQSDSITYRFNGVKWEPVGSGAAPGLPEVTAVNNTTQEGLFVTGMNKLPTAGQGLWLGYNIDKAQILGMDFTGTLQLPVQIAGSSFSLNGASASEESLVSNVGPLVLSSGAALDFVNTGGRRGRLTPTGRWLFGLNAPDDGTTLGQFDGNVSGANAIAANHFVTRQQVTDSLNARVPIIPNLQQVSEQNSTTNRVLRTTGTTAGAGWTGTGLELSHGGGTSFIRSTERPSFTAAELQIIASRVYQARTMFNGESDDGTSAIRALGLVVSTSGGFTAITGGVQGDMRNVTSGGGAVGFGSISNHPVYFKTNNNERGRIVPAGRLLWGGAVDDGTTLAQFNGNVSGDNAIAANHFVTRQQVTDSLNARPVPSWQAVTVAGNETDRFLRITGVNGVTGTGPGMELYFSNDANGATLQGYDRTASTYKPVTIGSSITHNISRMTVNNPFDDGTSAFQVQGAAGINGDISTRGASAGLTIQDRITGTGHQWAWYSASGKLGLHDLASGVDRVSILSGSGNVGIGTTTPFNKLSLPNNVYIGWNNVAGSNDNAGIKVDGSDDMIFYAGAERMFIKGATGLVGIATSDPQATLEVRGDIIASQSAGVGAGRTYIGYTTGGGLIRGEGHNGTSWVTGQLNIDSHAMINGDMNVIGNTTVTTFSPAFDPVIKTANFAISAATPFTTFMINNGGGAIAVTLPTASDVPGRIYYLKITSNSNGVTVDGTSVNMSWAPSPNGPLCIVQSNGGNWVFLQGF